MFSDDQRDWLSQTKHFRIIDPEGKSQPELEEGLGSLVTMLRREMERAEEQEREAAKARTRSQECISELRSGIREYRKALGLPEPPEDGGRLSLEQTAMLRKARAEADLAEERLNRQLPPEATSSQPSLQTGQSEDAHHS